MRRTALLFGILALIMVPAYVSAGQCGGFTTNITHTAPGEGSFTIVGSNDYGSVDVNGTFINVQDKETGAWECTVTFGTGSIIVQADETVVDISGGTLMLSGSDRGQKHLLYSIVQYVKSILEN